MLFTGKGQLEWRRPFLWKPELKNQSSNSQNGGLRREISSRRLAHVKGRVIGLRTAKSEPRLPNMARGQENRPRAPLGHPCGRTMVAIRPACGPPLRYVPPIVISLLPILFSPGHQAA